ncbi:NAD(P)/FAD-dependent oxidoreductase [Thioclava sp. FR2]|uniref:NAD(P)/FAD-dependent oxidoreductase n=1 Tax=Thioclava sp. FR2 TaxID=3445780 RepID=UPI003EBCC9B3
MSELHTYDLIVIGAGPAGATAACVAARHGLRVALVDKAPFPRNKLCGGGVTGRAMGHLTQAFGALPETLFHRCDEVQMTASGQPLGTESGLPTIYMTMRRDFDAALREFAILAGAADFCGRRVSFIDLDACQVTLVSGETLRGSVMIGADGINSAVARSLFGRSHDPDQVAFALEVEVSGETSGQLELDLSAVPWGYGWDFPKAGGRTLGLGGSAKRNPNMRQSFEAWLRARGVDPSQVKIKGHHLPMGDVRKIPGRGNILLAGDAAGLVDPITGEGIGWAVHSGQLAAEAAFAAISRNNPALALSIYQASARHMLRELSRARFLARLVYVPWLQPRFHALLASSSALRQRYLDLLAGKMDYADLGPARLGRMALRVLLRRA